MFVCLFSFFNPTIEVITFRLPGWCMLDVLLLPAFNHQGHECEVRATECTCAHILTSVYTLIRKSFGRMESEPMLTPREKSPQPGKFSSEEDRTHDAASRRTASPTHYQLSYSGPNINDLTFGGLVPTLPHDWRPPREREIPGSNPACTGIFSGSSHTSDFNIGTPVATLPGAWRYRVSAGTGRSSVSIL